MNRKQKTLLRAAAKAVASNCTESTVNNWNWKVFSPIYFYWLYCKSLYLLSFVVQLHLKAPIRNVQDAFSLSKNLSSVTPAAPSATVKGEHAIVFLMFIGIMGWVHRLSHNFLWQGDLECLRNWKLSRLLTEFSGQFPSDETAAPMWLCSGTPLTPGQGMIRRQTCVKRREDITILTRGKRPYQILLSQSPKQMKLSKQIGPDVPKDYLQLPSLSPDTDHFCWQKIGNAFPVRPLPKAAFTLW